MKRSQIRRPKAVAFEIEALRAAIAAWLRHPGASENEAMQRWYKKARKGRSMKSLNRLLADKR